MTRANLNFIYQNTGEVPKTLFCYHNGDQYPSGLIDFFNVKELFKDMTPANFKKWIKTNYNTTAKKITQPKIYYTDGFITDYSYIFETDGSIKVFEWDKLVFDGDAKAFIKKFKTKK